MLKQKQDVIGAKAQALNEGVLVQQLTEQEGYKVVIERLNKLLEGELEDLKTASTFEEYRHRVGYYQGLHTFTNLIDEIIQKARRLSAH